MPSTVIRRFDYDAERRELLVEFVTGRRYLYLDPAQLGDRPRRVVAHGVGDADHAEHVVAAQALRSAFAKGVHFNRRIRDQYRFRELAD